MFHRDAQVLVIHISRGTCTRGDIVIHISFAFARNNPQRGLKKTLVINISRGTCARGDILIHISFALAQHISQRGFKKVVLIVAYLKGVVLEL